MNKREEYKRLCRIRLLLLILAIVLALATGVLGVMAFTPEKTEDTPETTDLTVETTEETTGETTEAAVATAADETIGEITEETTPETEEITEESTMETTVETTEETTEETIEEITEETTLQTILPEPASLSELLDKILYMEDTAEVMEAIDAYANDFLPEIGDGWKKEYRAEAEEWFEALGDRAARQALDNWAQVCENWGVGPTRSSQARKLYEFLNDFFASKDMGKGGV